MFRVQFRVFPRLRVNISLHLNRFLACGIGSLPYSSPQEACDIVLRYLGEDIPFWPQLPKRDFKENMYVQYSQGLPGAVINEAGQSIYIDTESPDYAKEVESLYEHYLAEDLDYFAITKDYTAGLYEFVARPSSVVPPQYIKGHTIGPISFGLTVTDRDKKASIYNQEFRDCMVKALAMKARWQVRKLRGMSDEGGVTKDEPRIIIFIDEPYLVSIGSSFFNIKTEDVVDMLNEVIASIHQEGAFAGIHCCGNTDWSIVLKTGIDILNYDAYNYPDSIFLYRRELDAFLEKGGIIAWGVVPNNAEGPLPPAENLLERLDKYRAYLSRPGLITPSCGLSGVSIERSEEILTLTARAARCLSSG